MPINLDIQNNVAVLTLNEPKKLNALSSSLMLNISEILDDIEKCANVLVITGCEKAFAAGVDISEIDALSYQDAHLNEFIDSSWETILNVKIPVIAAVSGYALGGGFEMALMCDIIVAAESAVFGFPEVNLGLMPGMGGSQMLTKIVGAKIASELILTGDYIYAKRAYDLQIVSRIVDNSELMKKTMEIAEKISKKSTMSTRLIKDAIRMSQNSSLEQGMNNERIMFRSLFDTSFKKDGVKKFFNKKIKA